MFGIITEEDQDVVLGAAAKGDLTTIATWVHHNPKRNVNEICGRPRWAGCYAIHVAALHGRLDVVTYLTKEQQCDPNQQTEDGLSALHAAAGKGHVKVVKFLIEECQCDPNQRDWCGYATIHRAAHYVRLNVVTYLIEECQCDPNLRTYERQTAMHIAASSGEKSEEDRLRIVQFLLQNGAEESLSIRDKSSSSTPLALAKKSCSKSIVAYIEQYMENKHREEEEPIGPADPDTLPSETPPSPQRLLSLGWTEGPRLSRMLPGFGSVIFEVPKNAINFEYRTSVWICEGAASASIAVVRAGSKTDIKTLRSCQSGREVEMALKGGAMEVELEASTKVGRKLDERTERHKAEHKHAAIIIYGETQKYGLFNNKCGKIDIQLEYKYDRYTNK